MRGCTCTGLTLCAQCQATWDEAERRRLGQTLPPQDYPESLQQTFPAQEENEASFQARILRLAKQHGWRVFHVHDSRSVDWRSDDGFPDWVFCRESVIYAELKTRTGKLTHDQEVWLDMLSRAGQETYIWRPADWNYIAERLTQPWRNAP